MIMPRWKPFGKEKQRSSSFGGTARGETPIQHGSHSSSYDSRLVPVASTQSNNLEYDSWASSTAKTDSEITILKKDDDLKHAEVIIVVMGPTGAGKSRLIREASTRDVPIGNSLRSGSSHPTPAE